MLLLSTSLDVGGAERVVARLARTLPMRGFEVEVATLLPAGLVGRVLAAEGVTVHDLDISRKWDVSVAAIGLARVVEAGGFDLVSSFLFHANQVARMARLLSPRPWAHVASVRIAEGGRPWRQAMERLLLPLSERTVFVSEATRRSCSARGLESARVIRNGVEVPAARARRAPGASWIAVGRIAAQKGYDVLVEAWGRLAREGRAPALRILGRPAEAALAARLAERTRAARLPIEWAGEVADPLPHLLAARGFVLASREEGVPNALLEAMAAGLPSVATRAGGVPEVLAHGREGLLVPPGDAVALAEAVARIDANTAEADTYASAARARAESEHAVARMVDRWEAVYREVLAGGPRLRPRATSS